MLSLRFQVLSRAESTHLLELLKLTFTSLDRNAIPPALIADITALLADPFRAALASGEADTKPAVHD